MSWFRQKRIFLDYASATPVLPEVKRVMEKYWSEEFHNSSAIYEEGVRMKREVEECRARVARALGVSANGVIFTASGTESDSLAILGTFEKWCERTSRPVRGKKPHIIISAIEHSAVVAAAEEVQRRGGELSTCEVDEHGFVSLEALGKLLRPNTFLVSVGLANGEIGTVQPLAKIGRFLEKYRKERGSTYPYFHTDASQAPNYLPLNIENLQTDMLTLDGSKIYGPKGVGVLAVKKGVEIRPIILGGEQEKGRRAGTLNPALVAGFTCALELALKDREEESQRLEILRKYFIETITSCLPEAIINGSPNNHLPNIVSVSLPNTLSELILLKLDREGVMASAGSACSLDGEVSGSPVIAALGKGDLSEATLRFSFGRHTTFGEIKRSVEILCSVVK